MDACDATNVLISRIKRIDPENASKIMGYILVQGLSDADLASLATCHETLLRNVVFRAKSQLGIPSSSSSAPPSNPSSPSPLNPISRPGNPFPLTSPRVVGNGPMVDLGRKSYPHSWPLNGIGCAAGKNASFSPKSSAFMSYDNVLSGSVLASPFLKNGDGDDSCTTGADLLDECQFDEYLSFMDDSSSRNEEPVDPSGQLGGFSMDNGNARFHRRSFSESGACSGVEDGGFGTGYRPCMYYARGFCKNGESCQFMHSGFGGDNGFEGVAAGDGTLIGSPRGTEGLHFLHHEGMLRMKAAQHQLHQRLAYDKYMNFLSRYRDDPQRLGAAAEMIGDEFHKFNRFRIDRNDFSSMSMGDKSCSAARQIYLTFPADSAFRDEDVSNYFSTFGPVQDVRIPYQQKRMFGFVSFVHPETVKLVLARGNPHFICDSRVLVKPYKEKGNRRQHHFQQQLLEGGNFSPSSSPGFDPRDLFDIHVGPRMLQDAQELLLRRKLEEQAELQQAIELQGRRLVNLQLPDLRQDYARHHQRSLSVGSQIPAHAQTFTSHNILSNSSDKNHDDNGISSVVTISASVTSGSNQDLHPRGTANYNQKCGSVGGKAESYGSEGCCAQECRVSNTQHALPDSLFDSDYPKSAVKQHPDFSPPSAEVKILPGLSVVSSSENEESVTTNPAGNEASN